MQNNKPVDEEKAEPKESARMVENSDQEKELEGEVPSSRWEDLSKRAKYFASNRYNVIIVLLCIIVLIFFIIIIGLAARLGSYKCHTTNECRTAECLNSAASIVGKADFKHQPCQDFWSYSCKGWIDKHPISSNKGSNSIRDELQNNIYKRILHLIDLIPHDSYVHNGPQQKLKSFYMSCMNLADIKYWVPQKLIQAIQEIGGWAILNRPLSSQWKRNDVLKKLHVMYGVPVFFHILVEADDSNPNRNIIKLIPDGLGLPSATYYEKPIDNVYLKAYKELIKNLMQEMGVPLHEASRFSEDIFYYEKRLAAITPGPDVLRNSSQSYKILKVHDLDKLSTSVLWSELLQMYFPNVVRPNTEVAILSEAYFTGLSRLISTTDNTLLNDYYMWRFLLTYVPHLSSTYKMVMNRFKQSFEGVENLDLLHEEQWEFCIKLASRYMGLAVGSMYIDNYFPAQLRDKAETLIYKIVGSFPNVMSNVKWLNDQTSQDFALEKILGLGVEFLYPGFSQNCSLEEFYDELNIQSDYFQNIKEGIYFLHRKQELMLQHGPSQDCSWPAAPHDVSVHYAYAGNDLVVPIGLFELPLFDFNAPLAVKYGVLAGHVANKMVKMFDEIGINYETYGTFKPWLSPSSSNAYQMKLRCLQDRLSNVSSSIPFNPDLTLNDFVSHIGGVKLAYKAYKLHIQDVGGLGQLPGLDVNDDQLFFLSYAQSLCETTRVAKLNGYKDVDETLPAELKVLGVLQQIPEFYSTFKCDAPKASNMCHFW